MDKPPEKSSCRGNKRRKLMQRSHRGRTSLQLRLTAIHRVLNDVIGNITLLLPTKCLLFLQNSAIMNLVNAGRCTGPLASTPPVYVYGDVVPTSQSGRDIVLQMCVI